MRRRSLITFVVLNVLISLGVAFAVISALNPGNQDPSRQVVITVPVLITATPDPFASPQIIILTATPLPGQPQAAALPTGLLDNADLTTSPVATFDLALLSDDSNLQGTATALPPGCILHTVKEGDTPFGIAEQYGADGFALMELNEMDELGAANMQIGDVLIVPLEGCALTASDLTPEGEEGEDVELAALIETEEVTEEATDDGSTPTPTVRPTVTLAPTAANASVAIRDVLDGGDITAEGVEIINNGNTVNVNGWTLEDTDGNVFTFAEQLLFSGASLTVYTREGRNTPVVLYWGEDEAVWQPGDTVTLKDANGDVQSTFRVPEPIDLE